MDPWNRLVVFILDSRFRSFFLHSVFLSFGLVNLAAFFVLFYFV